MVDHAVHRLRLVGCQVSIAGSRPDFETYAPVLPDLHPGCGPLGGVEAALAAAPAGASILFLPVDLPLLPVSVLALLLERAARSGALATVPIFAGRPHPLCAVYHVDLLSRVTAALAAGAYKVMDLLDSLRPTQALDTLGVEAAFSARSDLRDSEPEPLHRWFANINTPGELVELDSAGRPLAEPCVRQRGYPR